MRSHDLGKRGEDFAKGYLKSLGYSILETNYRSKRGEIDIVAEEKGDICFIEVKTREEGEAWDAFAAVDRRKQRRMIRTAQTYLLEHFKTVDVAARFDVLAVYQSVDGNLKADLLRNAFEC
jgi:putative endonuclease